MLSFGRVLVARAHLIDACDGRSMGTYDTLENSYTPVPNRILLDNGKRIDYILYRAGKINEVISHITFLTHCLISFAFTDQCNQI